MCIKESPFQLVGDSDGYPHQGPLEKHYNLTQVLLNPVLNPAVANSGDPDQLALIWTYTVCHLECDFLSTI